MNIAFLAHDKKKELMVQFCTAYKSVLMKHNLFATATTGRLIIDNKFIEAIVKNDMILLDTLKVKYKDKLEERQAIRNRIDELEEIING